MKHDKLNEFLQKFASTTKYILLYAKNLVLLILIVIGLFFVLEEPKEFVIKFANVLSLELHKGDIKESG